MTSAATILDGKKLVFVVGAPRSGTTWLQLLLAQSSNVATAQETHLFSGYLKSMLSSWDRDEATIGGRRQIGLPTLYSRQEFVGLVREIARGCLAKIGERNAGAAVILEKTPDHLHFWRVILQLFPDAYFIHVVRDPRSVAASRKAAGRDWGSGWASSNVHKAAKKWVRMLMEGRSIEAATERYREVRYEDLLERGPEILRDLFAWLRIPESLEHCEHLVQRLSIENLRDDYSEIQQPWDLSNEPSEFFRKGNAESWREELSPMELFAIESCAESAMKRSGYSLVTDQKPLYSLLRFVAADKALKAIYRMKEELNKRRFRLLSTGHSSSLPDTERS